MNRKKSKRIKNHTEVLQVEWLKSLLNDEEASKGTIHNSFYTARWVTIKIKQLLRIFPNKQVEDITSEDVKWKMEQR